MKSVEELLAIKNRVAPQVFAKSENGERYIRVLVGLATCGIAAGARPVYEALVNEVEKQGLTNVHITQTGCIGVCQYEPVIEIVEDGREKVTYCKMTPEKAVRVVNDHLINGKPVAEYTIGAVAK